MTVFFYSRSYSLHSTGWVSSLLGRGPTSSLRSDQGWSLWLPLPRVGYCDPWGWQLILLSSVRINIYLLNFCTYHQLSIFMIDIDDSHWLSLLVPEPSWYNILDLWLTLSWFRRRTWSTRCWQSTQPRGSEQRRRWSIPGSARENAWLQYSTGKHQYFHSLFQELILTFLLQTRNCGLLEEVQCKKKTEGCNPYNYAGVKELFK